MGATLSTCGMYRYKLSREWGNSAKLAFIMLNPSTADAELDDPTIRRCIGFASDAGFDGIEIGNLFAWRSTDAAELKKAAAPIGPDNDTALAEIIAGAPVIVCAWGNGGALLARDVQIVKMISDARKVPHCLRMTKLGQPCHPLYLPASLRPVPMGPWAA
jgi:hypothetical protein